MNKSNYLSEIQLTYDKKHLTSRTIVNSADVEAVARTIVELNDLQINMKEYFFMILLNNAHKVIGYHIISEGGINATVTDSRIAFATALKALATRMILVHNHPSGLMVASDEDKVMTKRFEKIGIVMDIKLIEHIILGENEYFSFKDEGLLD
jgi:DNA repair protein RadC